jgi:hypothetical protein
MWSYLYDVTYKSSELTVVKLKHKEDIRTASVLLFSILRKHYLNTLQTSPRYNTILWQAA